MILKERIGHNYLKYLFTGTLSALLVTGYAQEVGKQQKEKKEKQQQQQHSVQGGGGEVQTMDSIDVVRDYRPMLADAVKVRRSPDMTHINRDAIETELRQIATATYLAQQKYKQAYYHELMKRHPDASQSNIDNYRISYLAYGAGEYKRASGMLEAIKPSDAFYQGAIMTLGHIALETGDKQAARNAFVKVTKLDLDQQVKADALFNYAKILFAMDSTQAAQKVLEKYIEQEVQPVDPGSKRKESAETLSAEILRGTTNFHAGVSMLESLKERGREVNAIYQKVTYYRGLEFYNERAFENSISMFMRSEKFPVNAEMAALATYWNCLLYTSPSPRD